MVTTKAFERCIDISDTIAQETGTDQDTVRRVLETAKAKEEKRRRQPAPPPPEGGISLSEAERKYNIPNETISRWAKRGYIPIIKRVNNKVFILESAIAEIASIYSKDAGRGSWIIKKSFENIKV